MKIKIDFECTPEEARKLMGLPDMGPIWDKTFEEGGVMREKLVATMRKNIFSVVDPLNVTNWKDKQ